VQQVRIFSADIRNQVAQKGVSTMKSTALTAIGAMPSVSNKRNRRMTVIMELLAERGRVALPELSVDLGVSASTIRRDLAILVDQRLLVRTHGGAQLLDSRQELPVSLRDTRSQAAKMAIAQATLAYIPRTMFAIGMSGGTTTATLARALVTAGYDQLRIVTNSLTIAQMVASAPHLKLSMSGGNLRTESLELVGMLAESTFNAINLGIAVLGADGVTAEGVTTYDETEARTNRAMASHASQVIVVVDGSKVGRLTLAQVMPIEQVDVLVTDSTADPAIVERIRQAGVKVDQVTV